jgi:hypothetical protein
LLKKNLDVDKFGIPQVVLRFITEQSKQLSVKLCERSFSLEPAPLWTSDNVDFVFQLISQKIEVNIFVYNLVTYAYKLMLRNIVFLVGLLL